MEETSIYIQLQPHPFPETYASGVVHCALCSPVQCGTVQYLLARCPSQVI